MKEEGGLKGWEFCFDLQAGPIMGKVPISHAEAEARMGMRDCAQIIEVVVWPYKESADQRPVLRQYYATSLLLAAVRAAEIEIRLREQELRAALAAIRPATNEETNTFFRVMDKLEASMPVLDEPRVKDSSGLLRNLICGVLGGKRPGERSGRVVPNTYIEGSSAAGSPEGPVKE